MTDNEIIKADELISKLHKYCLFSQMKMGELNTFTDSDFDCLHNLIDTINRQKTEIERLNIELKAMRSAANSYKAEVERLQCEVKNCRDVIKEQSEEWHKHYNDSVTYKTALDSVCKELRTAKSEARKEFVKKLEDLSTERLIYDGYGKSEVINIVEYKDIDNLLKEMEG